MRFKLFTVIDLLYYMPAVLISANCKPELWLIDAAHYTLASRCAREK